MKVCKALFEYFELDKYGNCYFCCSNRIALFKLGNINEKSFDEIWNSDIAIKMREEALRGNYPYCQKNACTKEIGEDLTDIKQNYQPYMNDYPLRVSFSISEDCNARCIFCRDKFIISNEDKMQELKNRFLNKCIPILKNTECIFIGDSEDPFASKLTMEIIKNIIEKYPKIKFHIQTNGILATKEKLRELNIEDKIETFIISVNAENAKTHSKIFRVSPKAFIMLKKNIENIALLKKENKIDRLVFNFVVNKYNYKEMVKFIKFAKKYDACINFWEVRNYHINLMTKYEDLAVHLPTHKEYKKLKNILSSSAFDNKNVHLFPCLKTIRENALKEKSKKFSLISKILSKYKK